MTKVEKKGALANPVTFNLPPHYQAFLDHVKVAGLDALPVMDLVLHLQNFAQYPLSVTETGIGEKSTLVSRNPEAVLIEAQAYVADLTPNQIPFQVGVRYMKEAPTAQDRDLLLTQLLTERAIISSSTETIDRVGIKDFYSSIVIPNVLLAQSLEQLARQELTTMVKSDR